METKDQRPKVRHLSKPFSRRGPIFGPVDLQTKSSGVGRALLARILAGAPAAVLGPTKHLLCKPFCGNPPKNFITKCSRMKILKWRKFCLIKLDINKIGGGGEGEPICVRACHAHTRTKSFCSPGKAFRNQTISCGRKPSRAEPSRAAAAFSRPNILKKRFLFFLPEEISGKFEALFEKERKRRDFGRETSPFARRDEPTQRELSRETTLGGGMAIQAPSIPTAEFFIPKSSFFPDEFKVSHPIPGGGIRTHGLVWMEETD